MIMYDIAGENNTPKASSFHDDEDE